MKTTESVRKWHGWLALILWFVLIVAGIIAKRIYGQPDWMVFFHLPAAVMLVCSFNILSRDIRLRYQEQLKDLSRRRLNRIK